MAQTAKTKPDETKTDYEVVTAFWLGPHLKKVGDTVQMTEDEAKYYVPHILCTPASKSKPKSDLTSSGTADKTKGKNT